MRPAAQLISAATAEAAATFLGRDEEAKFIRTFDSGFDALNGQCPTDLKTLRRGMAVGSIGHHKALDELEAAVSLKFSKKSSLLPFQKGFIVSIKSMRGVVADLAQLIGPNTYVLTGRINQDLLESFFSLVRGKGGANVNPSPSEAKSRVRSLTLLFLLRLGLNPLSQVKSPLMITVGRQSEGQDKLDTALMLDFLEECPAQEEQTTGDIEEVEALLEEARQLQPPNPPSISAVDPITGVSAVEYGIAHAAGYISAKCRRVDPTLGTPSSFADESAPLHTLWTRLRSCGGLSVPTNEWLDKFREMEAAFCTRHHFEPDSLSRKSGVVESMVAELRAKPGALDDRVIRRFVRLRTFIRISLLNRERRQEALSNREKRKRGQYSM